MTWDIRSGIEPECGTGWAAVAAPIAQDGILAEVRCIAGRPADLAEGEVQAWFANFRQGHPAATSFQWLLDRDERARADRFVFARHRERFMRAHGMLRLVLAPYVDRPPSALTFTARPFGKPELDDARGLSFSLSHSGDGVAIAVAQGVAVGIDIEERRGMEDRDALVARFFSAEEAAAYGRAAPAEREDAFFRLWTRKEAFVKGIGLGLSRPLDSFTVGLGLPVQLHAPDEDGWSLRHLEPGGGFVGALAARHPGLVLGGGQFRLDDMVVERGDT